MGLQLECTRVQRELEEANVRIETLETNYTELQTETNALKEDNQQTKRELEQQKVNALKKDYFYQLERLDNRTTLLVTGALLTSGLMVASKVTAVAFMVILSSLHYCLSAFNTYIFVHHFNKEEQTYREFQFWH